MQHVRFDKSVHSAAAHESSFDIKSNKDKYNDHLIKVKSKKRLGAQRGQSEVTNYLRPILNNV
jgi:hypothetical protein